MNFLIVGGAGYLGLRLAAKLGSEGHGVTVADLVEPGRIPDSMRKFQYLHTGARDYESGLARAIADSDTICNLAAMRQKEAERAALQGLHIPVDLNYSLISQMAELNPRANFIYMSSIHVYGSMSGELKETMPTKPGVLYGLGKRLGEDVVEYCRRRYSVKALSVRLANGFGYPAAGEFCDWDTVINDIAVQAVKKGSIELMSSGEQERNFITMQDTARALEFLADNSVLWPEDGLINLGSPLNMSIIEMARMIAARVEAIKGCRPGINRPAGNSGQAAGPFKYNIDRLTGMGFTWEQSFEAEIDGLINTIIKD